MKPLKSVCEGILSTNMDSDLPDNILGISYQFELVEKTDYTDPKAAEVRRKFMDMAAIKKDCGSGQLALQKHLIDTLCSSKLPTRLQMAIENDPNALGGLAFKRYLNSIQEEWNKRYMKAEYKDSKVNHIELSILSGARGSRLYYMHALLYTTYEAVWLALIKITPVVTESILSKNMDSDLPDSVFDANFKATVKDVDANTSIYDEAVAEILDPSALKKAGIVGLADWSSFLIRELRKLKMSDNVDVRYFSGKDFTKKSREMCSKWKQKFIKAEERGWQSYGFSINISRDGAPSTVSVGLFLHAPLNVIKIGEVFIENRK